SGVDVGPGSVLEGPPPAQRHQGVPGREAIRDLACDRVEVVVLILPAIATIAELLGFAQIVEVDIPAIGVARSAVVRIVPLRGIYAAHGRETRIGCDDAR